jgi:hypothetical protein
LIAGVLSIVHGNPLMMAGFDIVLYLDIAMQILLIGDDDSPPKFIILGALSLMRLEISSMTLTEFFSRDVNSVDCAIYIDRKPSPIFIDRLKRNSRSLILVADKNICGRTCSFISINSFCQPNTTSTAIHQVIHQLKSLTLSRGQREILQLILDPGTARKLEMLCENMDAVEQINEGVSLLPAMSNNKRMRKRQESQTIKMQVLEDWRKGKKREEILRDANISSRTLDRLIAQAKIRTGSSRGRQLISRL